MLGHAQYNTKHQCLCAPQSREPQNNRFLRCLVTKESPGPCLGKLLFCFSWSAWRYASRHPDDKHSFFSYENLVTTLRGSQKPGSQTEIGPICGGLAWNSPRKPQKKLFLVQGRLFWPYSRKNIACLREEQGGIGWEKPFFQSRTGFFGHIRIEIIGLATFKKVEEGEQCGQRQIRADIDHN